MEGGEFAGFVVALHRIHIAVPHFFCAFGGAIGVEHGFGNGIAAARIQYFGHGALRSSWAFVHHVVPTPHGGIADQQARRIGNCLGAAQRLSMIGHHQKIERSRQFCLHAGGGGHFLATGKAQRFFRAQPHAKAEGIDRVGGVEVGITP